MIREQSTACFQRLKIFCILKCLNWFTCREISLHSIFFCWRIDWSWLEVSIGATSFQLWGIILLDIRFIAVALLCLSKQDFLFVSIVVISQGLNWARGIERLILRIVDSIHLWRLSRHMRRIRIFYCWENAICVWK